MFTTSQPINQDESLNNEKSKPTLLSSLEEHTGLENCSCLHCLMQRDLDKSEVTQGLKTKGGHVKSSPSFSFGYTPTYSTSSFPLAFSEFRRKKRTLLSKEQSDYLEKCFAEDTHPPTDTIKRIANKIGLEHRVVKVWYQNRRARHRRQNSKHKTVNPLMLCPSNLSASRNSLSPSSLSSSSPSSTSSSATFYKFEQPEVQNTSAEVKSRWQPYGQPESRVSDDPERLHYQQSQQREVYRGPKYLQYNEQRVHQEINQVSQHLESNVEIKKPIRLGKSVSLPLMDKRLQHRTGFGGDLTEDSNRHVLKTVSLPTEQRVSMTEKTYQEIIQQTQDGKPHCLSYENSHMKTSSYNNRESFYSHSENVNCSPVSENNYNDNTNHHRSHSQEQGHSRSCSYSSPQSIPLDYYSHKNNQSPLQYTNESPVSYKQGILRSTSSPPVTADYNHYVNQTPDRQQWSNHPKSQLETNSFDSSNPFSIKSVLSKPEKKVIRHHSDSRTEPNIEYHYNY